jgi:hypothetical protein
MKITPDNGSFLIAIIALIDNNNKQEGKII